MPADANVTIALSVPADPNRPSRALFSPRHGEALDCTAPVPLMSPALTSVVTLALPQGVAPSADECDLEDSSALLPPTTALTLNLTLTVTLTLRP